MILARRLMRSRFGSSNVKMITGDFRINKFSAQHPELIMLGWIHTHPDYQAFLSSVDMHNQYLYQSLLPEALALVVSVRHFHIYTYLLILQPNYKEIGAFRLTETGLAVIGTRKA